MRVDVEYVQALLRDIRRINRLKFSDIEFYKGGVKVEADPAVVKHWKFTGLCNTDFVDIHLGDLK